MPEKTLNEIPAAVRETFEKGKVAFQRNILDYAFIHFEQVLQKEPGFYECREMLRGAQFKKAGTQTGFFKKMLGAASSQPMIAKGQMALRKDPVEAIAVAEQILNSDPNNTGAHKLLAEAAVAADFPRTAILSLEILVKASPKDRLLKLDLARAYARINQTAKAEAIYGELLRINPNDAAVAQAYKNLSARQTLDESGFGALEGGEGSYRDVLKDKAEAVSLEQEKRQMKSDDVTGQLILEKEERLAREPKNMKILRDLAELCAQKKEYDRSLEYYERIRSSEGGTDPSLERAIADTTMKRFDHLMSQLDPNLPEQAQQLTQLQAQRQEYQLSECKSRVERYPTDLQIRFDLGVLLFQAGKISEAMAEFQKAQNNPQRRLSAMSYLAQCFARRGMNDMAARRLQEALKEKVGFDDERKDLLYALGCVLEKMGKKDEAIEQFKAIYEEDIGYKDVAAKVDAYYAGQG
jgi:tetratricopeptide (TPR) repeat protein